MAGTLVVAGLWVRPLAESASQGGWRVVALDLFGDADTRRCSAAWFRIGDAATFSIAPGLLHDGLRAAREPGAVGWVAGSGFEGMPQALGLDVPGLPLLGMSAQAVGQVRDPAFFFRTLDRLGLPHPEVAFEAPAQPRGWLMKSAGGSGGWHIRTAGPETAGDAYWQRLQRGEPMSALFLADGQQARLVALNRLLVRPLGGHPFVYHGAMGPIRDDALARRMEEVLARLVPAFGLRGLASLDFLAHEGDAFLLEVNPRPSATMVLHPQAWPGGLMQAHVSAVHGHLPATPPSHPPGVRGSLIVFAERACRVGLALAADLALSRHCHDLPAPGSSFGRGEPVCSVSAEAADAQQLLPLLEDRAGEILGQLTPTEALVT